MQTRTSLQRHAQTWLDEAATLPPGNGPDADLWGGFSTSATSDAGATTSVDVTAMSPAELAEYEERKEKLRRAMGVGSKDERVVEEEESVEPEERRRKMIAAMEVGGLLGCSDRCSSACMAWFS
jgi:hypothetical protein